MKKRNGFTLIEITMAVLILAVITLITVPIVRTVINNANERAYNISVNTIEEAAKAYFYENQGVFKDDLELNQKASVTMVTLRNSGFLKEDIKNPKDDTIMNGYVEISIIGGSRYEYKYIEE